MDFYSMPLENLFRQLDASSDGLSSSEAKRRLEKYGKNQLEEEKKSALLLLASQFKSPLLYILFFAALISLSIGKTTDFIVILVIILLNASIGFVQELKAEKSIAALKKLTESRCKVFREGELISIPSSELVIGDLVLLHEGELAAADIRLIESEGLSVDESSLTGESVPVLKDHEVTVDAKALAYELKNSLLAGTTVVRGKARGIVANTGANTYLASIAKSAQEAAPQTPLEKAIAHFSKMYVLFLVALFALVGVIGFMQGRPLLNLGYILLAGMVSAVPEGLPLVITLVMAVGAIALSRHKALVRSLPAVETLGSINVIASDKTGTITQGILTVADLFSRDEALLKKISALCNDAEAGLGDPLDVALAEWSGDYETLRETYPKVWSYPFDTKLRLMATVHRIDGRERLLIKGAFESLAELTGRADLTSFERAYESLLDKGLRVLAFGAGEWSGNEDPASWNIELVGLIGLIDPAKKGVKEAVAEARMAGIHVMMITGDHPKTACAIAHQTSIVEELPAPYLTGKEIENHSIPELLAAIGKTSVLARILPEHKYKLVKALQSRGDLVAVTGDGVNDVPALKAADIGVAMGDGTAAAKDASDLVITDNNLSIIVEAIRNARVIVDNLRKVIYYLISTSLMEIFLLSFSIFAHLPLPMTAIQILWINIVTDGVQDKMFAFIKEEGDVMKRGPRRPHQKFLDAGQLGNMLYFGLGMGLAVFSLYYLLIDSDIPFEKTRTLIFSIVVSMQWANGLQAQKEKEPFFKNLAKSFTINPLIFLGVGIGVLIQLIPLYFLPDVFDAVPLRFADLAYPVLGFILAFAFVELRKWIAFWIIKP